MPIVVICRSCHQRFQVSDKFAGRQGPCPKCKAPIYIPKPEEEVKIHTPEHSEVGARGTTGQLVLKPVSFEPTRLTPLQIGGLVGGTVGLLVLAFAMRWVAGPESAARPFIAAGGVLLLSAPLAALGYTFLRDSELEPYRGLWLWIRAGICGACYALCWGIYVWLPPWMHDEMWKWVFVSPAFGIAGAVAAWASLELDMASGFFHFCFYVGATAILAATMGLTII
ncbi:MAG: hypothetical protein K8T25_12960 [Planctomycetia bacterium]|nr:hypothetical protein [Planctomycetia bacterium]